MAVVRYNMNSLTRAIEKTFLEITTNYHWETNIPQIDVGEELDGRTPSTHKSQVKFTTLRCRVKNEVEKSSFMRATSTP